MFLLRSTRANVLSAILPLTVERDAASDECLMLRGKARGLEAELRQILNWKKGAPARDVYLNPNWVFPNKSLKSIESVELNVRRACFSWIFFHVYRNLDCSLRVEGCERVYVSLVYAGETVLSGYAAPDAPYRIPKHAIRCY